MFFAQSVAKNPNNADGHYGLGMALAAEENYSAAIQEYSNALQLDPDSEGVYYEMGNSYLNLKKYDDAIAVFLKERQKNGDDQYIEAGLAYAYKAKGLKTNAEEAQHKADRMKADTGN
jgi:tetratricopeptide (TPR) repeat protein